jgi:phage major head subunit gpT-like protein
MKSKTKISKQPLRFRETTSKMMLMAFFARCSRTWGAFAAQHPDILIAQIMNAGFTGLGYDGQPFFSATHPVIQADGSTANISNIGAGAGTPWFLLDLSRAIKPFVLQRRSKPELVSQTTPDSDEVFLRNMYRYGVSDRKMWAMGFGSWPMVQGWPSMRPLIKPPGVP